MPKSLFSAVSVFSLDSSNLCREVKKLQVFYIGSFPPAVALDSKIRLSPIYSKYCKWIIFGRKIFQSPLCTPHVASGFLRTFYFFVKIFLSPRYVLHLLQVAVLMYSTYCKWLIFEIFFFRSPNYSKSPQRTPHVASGFWATFYFLVKIFLSPRYLLHLLQVAAGRKTVFRSLCFFAR